MSAAVWGLFAALLFDALKWLVAVFGVVRNLPDEDLSKAVVRPPPPLALLAESSSTGCATAATSPLPFFLFAIQCSRERSSLVSLWRR